MSDLPAAGWYDDPDVPDGLRWWDGTAWTDHRHVGESQAGEAAASDQGSRQDVVEATDEPSPFEPVGEEPDADLTDIHEADAVEHTPEVAVDDAAPAEGPAAVDDVDEAVPDQPEPAPWTQPLAAAVPTPPPPPTWTGPAAPAAPGAAPASGGATPGAWGAPTPTPTWGQPAWQPAPRPDRVSGKAAASLILSLLWLFGVASLVAIPLGVMGRREVAAANGTLDGNGMATAGIVVGALGTLFGILVVVALV